MAIALNWTEHPSTPGCGAVEQAPARRAIRLGWIAIALSLPCAAAIVLASGLSLIVGDMLLLVLQLPLLFALFVKYHSITPNERLAASVGGITMMTSAAILAGLICHAGLRLQMPLIDGALARADAALGSGMGADNVVTLFFGLGGLPQPFSGDRLWQRPPPLFNCDADIGHQAGRKTAWETACCFALAILTCSLISVFLPAIGNITTAGLVEAAAIGLPHNAGVYYVDLFNALRDGGGGTLDLGKLDGVVQFPSFHLVMALMIARAAATFPFCKSGQVLPVGSTDSDLNDPDLAATMWLI